MPAVVVVTEVFANLALMAAQARGLASLRLLVLPHPLEGRATDELRALGQARAGELRRLLTGPPVS